MRRIQLDEAFATLLIERGANPFDTQALYNTSIVGDDIRWLEFLWKHSEARGVTESLAGRTGERRSWRKAAASTGGLPARQRGEIWITSGAWTGCCAMAPKRTVPRHTP